MVTPSKSSCVAWVSLLTCSSYCLRLGGGGGSLALGECWRGGCSAVASSFVWRGDEGVEGPRPILGA